MKEKTQWEKCKRCGKYITKKTYDSQNGLCTICRIKELQEILGGEKT